MSKLRQMDGVIVVEPDYEPEPAETGCEETPVVRWTFHDKDGRRWDDSSGKMGP